MLERLSHIVNKSVLNGIGTSFIEKVLGSLISYVAYFVN